MKQLKSLGRSLDAVRSWRGRSFREDGDRARDEGRWPDAVADYQAYLRRNPADAGIWVQLGNCAKEAHLPAVALKAYDTAIALNAEDADAHLQKGHLLKITGNPDSALEAYQRSANLGKVDNPAFAELFNSESARAMELMRGGSPNSKPARHAIYLDVTDLIDYLRVNLSLSGIQRVVSNLVLFGLSDFADDEWGLVPVLPNYQGAAMMSVNADLLRGLIEVVARRTVNREAVDRALDVIYATREGVSPKAGDAFLIAGAFWIFHRYDILSQLRRAGVHVTVFIHDLIQVTNPEYVESAATTVFRRSLCDVLATASAILTNSVFVANEMRHHLETRTNIVIPVTPITLATELGMASPEASRVSEAVRDIAGGDYVLCVGTIEIRKNHLYLVQIWERLLERFDGAVPDLVIVGKWGWQVEALRAHLDGSDYLDGRLHILNAISDGDLAYLFSHCLFSIYPSFAEGWGLPVGESLGFGRPCIASKVTAIPEVGGSLCRYIDPFDLDDGYRVVAETLADREGLERWTREVRETFAPKTWRDFSLQLFETVRTDVRAGAANRAANNCVLDPAEVAPLGDDALIEIDSRKGRLVTARMARLSGWYGPEAVGAWMSRRRATLTFGTRLPEGTDIVVLLHLCTGATDKMATCTVTCGPVRTALSNLAPVPSWQAVPAVVGPDGTVDLAIQAGRGFYGRDLREQYLCLMDLMIYPTGDEALRRQAIGRVIRGL